MRGTGRGGRGRGNPGRNQPREDSRLPVCLSVDRRGVLGGEDEGRPGSDGKTRGLNASEGNRVFLQYRTESTALTLMSEGWIMNNHSQSRGAGRTPHKEAAAPGRGPTYRAYESDDVSLNHTEATAS